MLMDESHLSDHNLEMSNVKKKNPTPKPHKIEVNLSCVECWRLSLGHCASW